MKTSKFYIIFFLVISLNSLFGQSSTIVNDKIEAKINSYYKVEEPIKRKTLNVDNKFNPFIYVASGLLFVYQNILSEQISADCTYETSCSEYTKKCVAKHGFIKGSILGVHQLSCCSETVKQDLPEHRINKKGKIINEVD
jgi:putative component of membrane protein insertase Oxa1/YidC/SpoIIIJ protein YidD